MDRPGVRQVPEGSGEQRKMEETGCEVTCGAKMTPLAKGLVKVKNCMLKYFAILKPCVAYERCIQEMQK